MDTTLRDPSSGPRREDPLAGQVLDGRYRIDARIAAGGMATVYRGLDTRLDRVIALKVMHPGLAADAAFVERFIREAKAVARLDHPNVVGVYDQGADGGHVFLAMEYVAGCTLRDVLRERGALQPRAALDVLEPIAAALGAAHLGGLVHRDMKPENVLIGDDGRVKVADFGLVRAVDTDTTASPGTLLGTVSYLAPEQIEHGTADPRVDVYACGIMLYEMLTGTKPHSGGSAAQVLYQHLHEDVPAPSATVPGLAPGLDRLVREATARAPGERPEDAATLLALAREVRGRLTAAELDAVPPRAATPAASGSENRTSVLPRHRAPQGAPPPSPARPYGEGASGPRGHGGGRGAHGVTALGQDGLERTSVLDVEPEPPDGPHGPGGPPAARRRAFRRRPLQLTVAVLLALVAAVGVWYINSGQFTRVPGVLGEPRAAAERTLQEAGLKVRVEQGFSDVVERGRVISTDPGRGERIRDRGTVTLRVSKGPDVVEIPDLRGVPLAQARERLRELGLVPGVVDERFDDTVARGSVISTNPESGSRRKPDSAVALTVSQGEPVDAPDVTGEAEADARQELEDAGLKVKIAAKRVFSDEDAGTVAEQSPAGGSTLAEGDTVTLTLSKGPETVTVPDVEGRQLSDARRELEDLGFTVKVSRFFFGDTVFDQSVDGGEEAPKGSEITLRVR
ncbi:Stk1 family PASTA domain-containing Ser/Thr kinase [Streptomyces zingiberis]|uniref:non-specific serine/threonine protein kinase n=1 Tax=Streptomyces zingiberis TaxID=2053010 RepID=A0ABX1C132_9ACTN|nr:Stk1 family PASTA domain-containing Ser/Thr kinase [Streptomyces zingiberis]NJQ02375.1 Stk1 family PASTA domain-containing Ser/Thr kinase [Streptomyces zingiberis]